MGSYAKILSSASKGRKQLWYIYGPEPALRQDALELAQTHARSGVDTIATTTFIGSEVTGEEVLRRLSEPVPEQRSIVTLLDADKFTDWDVLLPVLGKMTPKDFFIAVSTSATEDTTLPHLRLFIAKAKSRIVCCSTFTEEQMVYWIESRLHIRRDATRYLIDKSNGNHEWVLNAMRKLALCPGEITLNIAETLCSSNGCANIITSLLCYRKRSAIISLQQNTPGSFEASKLAEDISKCLILQDAFRSVGHSMRELVDRTKMPTKEIARLKPSMKFYDAANGYRCISTLSNRYRELGSQDKWSWMALISRW